MPHQATVMRRRSPAISAVLCIGDGLGFAQLAAARYCFAGQGVGLALDRLPVWGQMTTHAFDALVTDSAAAGTAWATGRKTRNGYVSVDPHDGRPLPTILEYAQAAGMATGLVATSRLTYATPAVHAAHVVQRGWEGPLDVTDGASSIAEQYLAHAVDILLGGGANRFPAALLAHAAALGYALPTTAAELAATTSSRLLGLFAPDHMAYERQRPPEQPSLAAMTRAALRALQAGAGGYFLMVEGSRIDHAAHVGDAETMLDDIRAFDEAIAVALAETGPDTLIVVTADHETGGLTLLADPSAARAGLPVTTLPTGAGPLHLAFATGGHTAQPVPVAARDPAAGTFAGQLDNTDIFHRLQAALGLEQPPPLVVPTPDPAE